MDHKIPDIVINKKDLDDMVNKIKDDMDLVDVFEVLCGKNMKYKNSGIRIGFTRHVNDSNKIKNRLQFFGKFGDDHYELYKDLPSKFENDNEIIKCLYSFFEKISKNTCFKIKVIIQYQGLVKYKRES